MVSHATTASLECACACGHPVSSEAVVRRGHAVGNVPVALRTAALWLAAVTSQLSGRAVP